MRKRVVLVDGFKSTRQMLAAELRREPEYHVAGEAGTGLQGLNLCREFRPELVILELILPELSGEEVVRRLRHEAPQSRILVFSAVSDPPRIADMLRCRPHGFIGKQDSLETLQEGIRIVGSGGAYYTPFATELLHARQSERAGGLTDREREVVQLIAESFSSKQIAHRLGLAVKTVENHRANAMARLRVHDVAGLTRYAIRNGFV